MKHLLSVLALALLLFPLPAAAQHWITKAICTVEVAEIVPDLFAPLTLAEARAAAAEIPNGVGKFWRIEAPSGAVSHLWGTVHSTDPRLVALPDPVLAEIAAARVVALEVDFTYDSRRRMEADRDDPPRYRNTRTVYSFDAAGVPPEIAGLIRSRTSALGWGREAADYLTLGALAELLLIDPCDDFTAGVYPIQDGRIHMLGLIAGAEIVGLEQPNRLRAHFDRPENAETVQAMLQVYASYLAEDGFHDRVSTSIALYLAGEMGLWEVLDDRHAARVLGPEGAQLTETLDAYLIDQRNHDFIEGLAPLLPGGGVLVAVGAGHIAGDQGMVALLRGAGYTVTRVPVAGEAE